MSNYNFNNIEKNFLVFQKKEVVEEKIKNVVLYTQVNNTSETWQKDREYKERYRNTLQGKIAEDMFIEFVMAKRNNSGIEYLSYDEIRMDENKKHAPFDGLLYKRGNPCLSEAKKRIIRDLSISGAGKITVETRNFLRDSRIYSVEIKSSMIPERLLEGICESNFNQLEIQKKLVSMLRTLDIFSYPLYFRDKGEEIGDFTQYCNYIKSNASQYGLPGGEKFCDELIANEIDNKSHIHTRIFIDKKHSKSYVGYFTGYALNHEFFEEPKIIKMYREGKSEKALYYVFPIRKARALVDIFEDERLWPS